MVMNPAVLAAELDKMNPTDDEVLAAERFAAAYKTFAYDAVGSGVPILPAGPDAGELVMIPLLAGMSADAAAPALMQAAVAAFWVAAGPLGWPAPMVVVPPPSVGFAAALLPVLAANVVAELSQTDSATANAAAMYADVLIGGTVAIPPASPLPIL